MIAACEAAGTVLMVGQSLRHDPAHRHVKDLVAKGAIGEVGHVMPRWYDDFDPTRPGNPYGSWYLDKEPGGICLLHTFGAHVFDIMPWFIDSPVVRVYAQGSRSTALYEGQSDSNSAMLTHRNGAISALSQSIVSRTDAYASPTPVWRPGDSITYRNVGIHS